MDFANCQINHAILFPYQLGLQHLQAASEETEWNGRFVVHLILVVLELLPTGINYIVAIIDAIFNQNVSQANDSGGDVQTKSPPLGYRLVNASDLEQSEAVKQRRNSFLEENAPQIPNKSDQAGCSSLPDPILLQVSKFLTLREVGSCARVCKSWKLGMDQNSVWSQQAHRVGIIHPKTLKQSGSTSDLQTLRAASRRANLVFVDAKKLFQDPHPPTAFGKKEWIQYIGDPGEVPPLPPKIYEILQAPCPFWPGKTVEETHTLTLIPRTVTRIIDEVFVTTYLTARKLNNLVRSANNGAGIGYYSNPDNVLKAHGGDTLVAKPYWALMTNDVVPDSKNCLSLYKLQSASVEQKGYQVPDLLSATGSILLEHIRSGRFLFPGHEYNAFSRGPIVYTHIKVEKPVGWTSWVPLVGHFYDRGLSVVSTDLPVKGTAGLRIFK